MSFAVVDGAVAAGEPVWSRSEGTVAQAEVGFVSVPWLVSAGPGCTFASQSRCAPGTG